MNKFRVMRQLSPEKLGLFCLARGIEIRTKDERYSEIGLNFVLIKNFLILRAPKIKYACFRGNTFSHYDCSSQKLDSPLVALL